MDDGGQPRPPARARRERRRGRIIALLFIALWVALIIAIYAMVAPLQIHGRELIQETPAGPDESAATDATGVEPER